MVGSERGEAEGVVYVVSTPIGNLGDVTFRAVELLGDVDLILAEDTRRTRVLLDHYGIEGVSLVSFHKHNAAARTEQMLERLRAGEKLALVSDSGTPMISDPGSRLVQGALELGARVVPIPGPSAALAALVASGLDPEPFTFFGFLARSGRSRRETIERLSAIGHTAVIYESPQRLERTLRDLRDATEPERRVVVARELTKLHEEFVRGTLDEALAYYRTHAPRGEVVICLAAAVPDSSAPDLDAARAHALEMAAVGASSKEIVRELRARFGLERNRAYDLSIEALEGKDE